MSQPKEHMEGIYSMVPIGPRWITWITGVENP